MEEQIQQEQLARRQKVLDKLKEMEISYDMYEHPPLPTIEMALEYWKDLRKNCAAYVYFTDGITVCVNNTVRYSLTYNGFNIAKLLNRHIKLR